MQQSRQEQFLSLYEPVHERFERFCRARVYGKMEFRDLMHETLLVAYEKHETLKAPDAFLTFLIGISIRILANRNRKKQDLLFHEESAVYSIPDTAALSSDEADIHFLYEALAQLPEEQQESLILFEISGFSIREIAVMHNASESAVKQRLKRGREKLVAIITYESALKTGGTHHG